MGAPVVKLGGGVGHIAVSIRNLWYFRNLAPVIEGLAQRGHQVDLLCGEDRGTSGAEPALDRLVATYPDIRFIPIDDQRRDSPARRWFGLEIALSLAIDRLHFRAPIFDQKGILRARSEAKGAGPLLTLVDRPLFGREAVRKGALRFLRWLTESLPLDWQLLKLWRDSPPNLLIVCPLIDIARPQFDQLRTAKALGIRTAVFVHSWDNLSSKSWLRRAPDAILVWNEMQRQEIAAFHGLPQAKVHICGAPHYDEWFTSAPKVTREAFHSELGLDPHQKTILFVGSAVFQPPLTQHCENDFLRPWLEAIRASQHPAVRHANIILRPHPKRRGDLRKLDLSGFERVRIWPSDNENPVSSQSRWTYFHSLIHSDAVVGLNTSAFLEAAILGRPVFTVLDARFEASQRGTFHMEWLLGSDGKPSAVRAAASYDEHFAALEQCLSGEDPFREEERRFITGFVRPNGLEKTATQAACEALEAVAAQPAQPPRPMSLLVRRLIRFFLLKPLLATNLARRQSVAKALGGSASWRRAEKRAAVRWELEEIGRRLTALEQNISILTERDDGFGDDLHRRMAEIVRQVLREERQKWKGSYPAGPAGDHPTEPLEARDRDSKTAEAGDRIPAE